MKIGFAKSNLLDAIDWQATTTIVTSTAETKDYSREEKFDIVDRVLGMWRPEDGGCREVIQPLFISVLYGEEEESAFVLLSMDHCEIEYQDLDIMRDPILAQFNLSKDLVVFLPSHCHVTVKYDINKLQELIITTVKQAKEKMSNADIATVNLDIDGNKFVINRRIHVDGIGSRTIMFNDFCNIEQDHLDATEQITEWIRNLGGDPKNYVENSQRFKTHKKVDNQLQAILFRNSKSKELVGSFVRFAAHAVIVSEKKVNGDISADYPGYLKNKLESKLGGVALFAQGEAGDMRPLNKEYSHKFAKSYGEKLADEIISVYDRVKWKTLNRLKFCADSVKLPLRKDLPTDLETGELNMMRIEEEYDQTEKPERKRILQNDFWYYYRCTEVSKLLRPEWLNQGFIDTYLYSLNINDTAILMHSGELFYATGLEMIKPFTEKNIITASIANECLSYIPPKEEIKRGGYEPSVCLVSPESAEIIISNAHALLTKIYKS